MSSKSLRLHSIARKIAARKIQNAVRKTQKNNRLKNPRLEYLTLQASSQAYSRKPSIPSKSGLFLTANRNNKKYFDQHVSSFLGKNHVNLNTKNYNIMLEEAKDFLDDAFLQNKIYRNYLLERGVNKELMLKISTLIMEKDIPTLIDLGLYHHAKDLIEWNYEEDMDVNEIMFRAVEKILTARKIAEFCMNNRYKLDNVQLSQYDIRKLETFNNHVEEWDNDFPDNDHPGFIE